MKIRYHGRSHHRAGDRPRPLRRRPRLRPDRGDHATASASPGSARCSPTAERGQAGKAEPQLRLVLPLGGGVGLAVEGGEADAEQADRARRVVGPQQVEGDLGARMTPGSLVGDSTDWERLMLVQSSRRTLIPIDRPSSSAWSSPPAELLGELEQRPAPAPRAGRRRRRRWSRSTAISSPG